MHTYVHNIALLPLDAEDPNERSYKLSLQETPSRHESSNVSSYFSSILGGLGTFLEHFYDGASLNAQAKVVPVEFTKPCDIVGLDYAEPLLEMKARNQEKLWAANHPNDKVTKLQQLAKEEVSAISNKVAEKAQDEVGFLQTLAETLARIRRTLLNIWHDLWDDKNTLPLDAGLFGFVERMFDYYCDWIEDIIDTIRCRIYRAYWNARYP